MTLAYKHLDSKLRVAELTVGQWLGALVGLGVGIAWGFYVSPLGPHLTLFSAVYLAALPAGAVLLANSSELDLGLTIRAAARWLRADCRYAAGAGQLARGYVVHSPQTAGERRARTPTIDIAGLWDG